MAGPKVKLKPIRNSNRTVVRTSTDGIPIEDMDLTSNAFSDKQVTNEPIPLIKTTIRTGKVRRRKKPFLNKITNLFFGEDAKQVMDFIMHDILIPAAKSTITDAVTGGIERLIYGDEDRTSDRLRRDKGRSIVSYGNFYGREKQKPVRSGRRSSRDIDEFIFDKREEANAILESMLAALEEYQEVSVADYYDLVGITSTDFTTQNYGWTNLRGAMVERVRGGYLIRLPDTEALS